MTAKSLADHFNEYFEIDLANTKELKKQSYHIRHQVYSEELGWEPKNSKKMETDEFDHYSLPLLLKHKRTNKYVGTLRLIIPPPDAPDSLLPFEAHRSEYLWPHVIDINKLPRGSFGEISRLAIIKSFRRRKGEKESPYGIDNQESNIVYSHEEKRYFSIIAVGLYLGVIAMVNACNHSYTFALIENRLEKRLHALGLNFVQCGEKIEYHHGFRAVYFLAHDDFTINLNPQTHELYETIEKSLKRK